MNGSKKLLITIITLSGLLGTTVYADAVKGQKLYSKKLKKACDMTGAKMASQHTQGEWERKKEALADEIKAICPNVENDALKDKYLEHYYDFFYEYASDSGNVPSC